MGRGKSADAKNFWLRYAQNTEKDLPVILQTKIKASTLSSYKTNERFPRADEAVKIARALGVTVEYLVEGTSRDVLLPAKVMLLAQDLARLNDKDFDTVSTVVKALLGQYQIAAEPYAFLAAERTHTAYEAAAEHERDALHSGRNFFPNELDQARPDDATKKKA